MFVTITFNTSQQTPRTILNSNKVCHINDIKPKHTNKFH